MKQIDLDDLPPRIAQLLASLAEGEELVLAQGGVVVARLTVSGAAPLAPGEAVTDLAPEDAMKEVMEHFSSMIQDEF